MITLNSTILSYNKIREIEEYKPMLPPDSIYIQNESSNRSFQKFIPDIYDLDKINFKDFNIRRTFTPKAQNQVNLKKFFGSSIILPKNDNNEKYIESYPNIYTNEKERNLNYKNIDEIDFKKEGILNNDIYKNEKNKINENIAINLNTKKISPKSNKKSVVGRNHKEEIPLFNNNDNDNTNIDIITSKKTSLNKNGNDSQKFDKNSVHSEVIKFNYKNIMRKDPSKDNVLIFNTSFYKKRNKNGNKKKFNKTEINNRNNFNSFLKFEESMKEDPLRTTVNNKKEEILKSFMNSNSNINNSKLDKSNMNSLINDYSNLNINNILDKSNINNNTKFSIEEKDNENEEIENDNLSICEDKKSIKCNNLTNYTFRTGKTGGVNQAAINPQNLNKTDNIFNNSSEKVIRNLKYSEAPILNYNNNINNINFNYNNNNGNQNINITKLSKKPVNAISSVKKYNFDFPKKINENEHSKDTDNNKEKSFMSNDISGNEVDKKLNIINSIKKNIKPVFIKFNNMKKILKKNGLFNVLTFLDCYDLMCMLKTNKSFIFLINKAISDAYYHIIKNFLIKFKNDFELLKCSLIYTKVKDALKIDFVINIRFVNNKNNKINDNSDKKDFFKLDTENKIIPKCFQLIYFYNYFKSMYPQQKLKTKENTKKIKMYDYYTFDLYPESDQLPNIYINKEQLLFKNNSNNGDDIDKLLFIQPILPFKINDKGIINLEIYSSNNDFINPSSIKIILKYFDLKKYLNDLNLKGYNNLRICEYENICFHWKLISNKNSRNKFKDIIIKIQNNFRNFFYIQDISYESIGYFIFKINLLAIRPGQIDNSQIDDDFGINIIIRNKKDVVENEIKKNSLLLDRREIYEMRVGDTITLYFSTKIKK